MGLPQATAAPAAEPPSGFLVSFQAAAQEVLLLLLLLSCKPSHMHPQPNCNMHPGHVQELYKSMAPSTAPPERTSHHSPRGGLPGRKGSGSRPGGSAGGSASSSSKSLDAGSLPPLAGGSQHAGQEPTTGAPLFSTMARLPSLRKAISSPVLQDLGESPMPAAAPASPAAAAAVEELPAAGLQTIPEQRSSESEPASQPVNAHVLGQAATAAKKQQAAEEAAGGAGQASAADDFNPAVHAISGGNSPVHGPGRAAPQHAELDSDNRQQVAHVAARGLKSFERPPSKKAGASPTAAAALPAASGDSKAAAAATKGKVKQQAGGSSVGSGIAKSASSLLNKLLGRKPAAAPAATATAGPSAPGPATAAAPKVPTTAPAAVGMSPPPSSKQKQRLSPPPVQIRAYATSSSSRDYSHVQGSGYGLLASPRSRGSPTDGSPGATGLVRRVPSGKLGGSTSPSAAAGAPSGAYLRSPSLSRSMSNRQAPQPPSASPGRPAAAAAPAGGASPGASPGLPPRSLSTKGVRFAPADLSSAGPSGNVEVRS